MLPQESRPLFSYENLEGEYTSWRFLWSRHWIAPVWEMLGPLVDNFGNCYFSEEGQRAEYVLTRTNVLTILLDYEHILQGIGGLDQTCEHPYSLGRKYVVCTRVVALTWFTVFRRGVQIFTRNVALDDPNCSQLCFTCVSPNGRYILFSGSSSVTGILRWTALYEGVEP